MKITNLQLRRIIREITAPDEFSRLMGRKVNPDMMGRSAIAGTGGRLWDSLSEDEKDSVFRTFWLGFDQDEPAFLSSNPMDHEDFLDMLNWGAAKYQGNLPRPTYESRRIVKEATVREFTRVGIQRVYGENRVDWFVHNNDVELAVSLLRSMKKQGEHIFIRPTILMPDYDQVVTRQDLERLL